MLLLELHVLLFVKFLKSFHGKIKIIDYLLQWECPSLVQDLAEQNMKNYFIHQISEDGHPVMSNKSASNFTMDEYLVSLQLKGKSELTWWNNQQPRSATEPCRSHSIMMLCCHIFSFSSPLSFPSSRNPRALSLTLKTKSPLRTMRSERDRQTDSYESKLNFAIWSEPILSLSLWFCFRFWKDAWSWKSTKGKHLGWAKLVCLYSPIVVLMVLARFVPWALAASLFLINTTCAECECSLQWVEAMAVWTQLLALHSGDKDKDNWKGSAGKDGGLVYCTTELKALCYKRQEQFDESFEPH